MIANYKAHGFEIRARILPEACTACPFYLYSVSCDDAVCFLTGSGIPTDGPQDEGRAPDCPIKAVEVENKPSVDKDYLMHLIQEAVYDGEACSRLLDLVDERNRR